MYNTTDNSLGLTPQERLANLRARDKQKKAEAMKILTADSKQPIDPAHGSGKQAEEPKAAPKTPTNYALMFPAPPEVIEEIAVEFITEDAAEIRAQAASDGTSNILSHIHAADVLVASLRNLSNDASAYLTKVEAPGRKQLLFLVSECYSKFLQAEASPSRAYLYKQLRKQLKADGIGCHADAPNAAVVIRAVFSDFGTKRVSMYARVLNVAMAESVDECSFIEWVDSKGGFEKIRAASVPKDPASLSPAEQDAFDLGNTLEDWLDLRRETPFVEIALTPEQKDRLKSGQPLRLLLVGHLDGDTLKLYEEIEFDEVQIGKIYKKRFGSTPTFAQCVKNAQDRSKQSKPAP